MSVGDSKADCDYAVIGGGLAGLHCARKLADLGFHVTVFESTNRLINGATRKNMARIHHGWHYPGSSQTALGCIPAAFDFLEEFCDVLIKSPPGRVAPFDTGWCALAKDSFTSKSEFLDLARMLRSSYTTELATRTHGFGPPEHFFRTLDEQEWANTLNPDRVLMAASTLEPFVDLSALAERVERSVREHPRISVLTNHEVIAARPATESSTPRIALRVQVADGNVAEFRANRVLNASWISRMKLDAQIARHLGAAAPGQTTYRLRVLLRLGLTGNSSVVPSLLVAHGPFCTFTNFRDGTGLVMYEPVSNVAAMSDHVPEDWSPLLEGKFSASQRAHYKESILAGIREFVPGLTRAKPLDVMASALYHDGSADIYDRESAIHHRLGTGVKALSGEWLSLDTGKLSWVSRYANEVARLSSRVRPSLQVKVPGPRYSTEQLAFGSAEQHESAS